MGREVRRVPADWQHPRGVGGHDFRPLHASGYESCAAEWDESAVQWERGFCESYGPGEKWQPRAEHETGTYAEYAGERPRQEDYMPTWTPEQADHLMMYEDTTEGTPISPAFKAPEELARWLADNGASSFGASAATYEQWLPICKGGYAPSMVMMGGQMLSGVEAMAELKA